MKSRTKLYTLCVVTLVSAFAGTAYAQASSRPAKFSVAGAQIQALGIQTVPLQAQAEPVKVSFPAQVVVPVGAEQIVSSSVAGLVNQLLVQQYQSVRAGDPLVRLVSPELGQLQLQLLQAASRATLAQQASKREQLLLSEGIIPQRRAQEASAAQRDADAALIQAKAALRIAGMSAAAIDRIVKSGEPEDGLTLTASKAGIVTEILVKQGQRVDAATALLNVAQTGSLGLEIQLPASETTEWPIGTKLDIQVRDVKARVVGVSPTVSPTSQTSALRAVIDGKSGTLRPGEFVTVEMSTSATQGSWDVPLAAVAHEGKQAYIFVRTAEGFEAKPVTVVATAGQRVRTQGPLKVGDHIAVSGIVALKGAWQSDKGAK